MARTPAKSAASKKAQARSGSRSNAGRSAPKHEAEKTPGDVTGGTVQSPARSAEDIRKERAGVMPEQVTGVGTSNRLLGAIKGQDEKGHAVEQDEVDLTDLVDVDPSSVMVKLKEDVYEEFLAPGSKTRYIRKLRWRKGRAVSKAELDRHAAAQRKARKEREAAEGSDAPHADDPTGGTGQ